MGIETFATPYPVMFYDGEQEYDKGQIGVHSVLTFKRFQEILSQKTGILANQLSAVFVCRRTLKDKERRQKLPINESTNFNIILNQHNPKREKDCYFLVSLKKSKKDRKGITKKRVTGSENGDDEESLSPRDHFSLNERSKADSSEESSPEASSPISWDNQSFDSGLSGSNDGNHNQSFAAGFTGSNPGNQRHCSLSRSKEKHAGVEKLVQARETGGQVSPGSDVAERRDVANLPVPSTGGSQVLRLHLLSSKQPLSDQQLSEKQSEDRLVEKMTFLAQGGPPLCPPNSSSKVDISQNSSVKPVVVLPRKGISTEADAAYRISARAGTVQVSTGSSGRLATGSDLAQNLQHAQAQYLSSQKQHPIHFHTHSQETKGVVQGLASLKDVTNHSINICGYCCSYKEQNIYPMPFHLCAQDKVTMGFHGPSPAGPIERPVKRLEAAA